MINENEIARCVRRTLDGYFRDLEGEKPAGVFLDPADQIAEITEANNQAIVPSR